MGPLLRALHLAGAACLVAAAAMGYGARWGLVGVSAHVPWGFFLALAAAFPLAMTIFYLAGIGVALREAAAGRPWSEPLLAESAALRRRLAWPIGLALVSLMATVILGGGSHTRWLPSWMHHGMALSALGLNLSAAARARGALEAQAGIARQVSDRLESAGNRMDRPPVTG